MNFSVKYVNLSSTAATRTTSLCRAAKRHWMLTWRRATTVWWTTGRVATDSSTRTAPSLASTRWRKTKTRRRATRALRQPPLSTPFTHWRNAVALSWGAHVQTHGHTHMSLLMSETRGSKNGRTSVDYPPWTKERRSPIQPQAFNPSPPLIFLSLGGGGLTSRPHSYSLSLNGGISLFLLQNTFSISTFKPQCSNRFDAHTSTLDQQDVHRRVYHIDIWCSARQLSAVNSRGTPFSATLNYALICLLWVQLVKLISLLLLVSSACRPQAPPSDSRSHLLRRSTPFSVQNGPR